MVLTGNKLPDCLRKKRKSNKNVTNDFKIMSSDLQPVTDGIVLLPRRAQREAATSGF